MWFCPRPSIGVFSGYCGPEGKINYTQERVIKIWRKALKIFLTKMSIRNLYSNFIDCWDDAKEAR